MLRFVKVAIVGVFAAVLSLALSSPASADVSVRDGKAADLYVRSAAPSLGELERQFAGFWNPNVPIGPKLEVSYNGAAARPALEKVMANARTMDFMGISGRAVGPVKINGNAMSVTVNGVMAGFPAQTFQYHYLREGGLWKFDWKRTCQSIQCAGNPNFGY